MAAMDRRRFLSHSISASALVASGISLLACSSSIELQPDFLYGVASGAQYAVHPGDCIYEHAADGNAAGAQRT